MSTSHASMSGDFIVDGLPQTAPNDEHNRKLVSNVHPLDWVNPEPASRYDMVVIGGGTAGLVTAAGAAGLGARVALVERHLLGGDCLNVGCVPSKALIAAARIAADARRGADFGVRVQGVEVDFAAVMTRMRALRAAISPHDSAARFRGLGIDVFIGDAAFTGPDVVEVEGKKLRFKRATIATGARATGLPVPGLSEAGFLTNETLFSLTELPKRLAILGAGPIGCEMAQCFARFGSTVTLLEAADHILIREDPDAAACVAAALARDGVVVYTKAKTRHVERVGATRRLSIETVDGPATIEVDHILLGVGRAPNVEGMGLEAAGVDFDPKSGVKVDERLRTSNRRVFAAGDVCFPYKFTHTADAMARIVIGNALFFGRARTSSLVIPWCTYTDPEIAHVGVYENDAKARGIAIDTYRVELGQVDRSILEGDREGFLKIHTKKGSDKILGATLVGRHAGDILGELGLAVTAGIGLGTIAKTIHAYPTQAEVIKKAADAYNRTRLTPFTKRLLGFLLRLQR